ncbi:hypothetical protein V5799_031988 [Amblyomma americanum]|uniref:Uncharacterized protein n=1 Tax=Amblyomma americanum TaxID=6943 RepID=A0AAQ4DSG6_AMBAM
MPLRDVVTVTCGSRTVVVAARAPVCQLGNAADAAYGAALILCPCPLPSTTRGGALSLLSSVPPTPTGRAASCTVHAVFLLHIWPCSDSRASCKIPSFLLHREMCSVTAFSALLP